MSLPKSAVRFETYAYLASHGQEPRGKGGWAFCTEAEWRSPDTLKYAVWFNGAFTEAKDLAARFFAERDERVVMVMP